MGQVPGRLALVADHIEYSAGIWDSARCFRGPVPDPPATDVVLGSQRLTPDAPAPICCVQAETKPALATALGHGHGQPMDRGDARAITVATIDHHRHRHRRRPLRSVAIATKNTPGRFLISKTDT